MEKTVISTKELAQRWDTTPGTITAAVDEGKLLALIDKGVGSHRRFSIKYVEDVEKQGGFNALTQYDVLRVHRLEMEIEKLKGIIQKLKSIINGITMTVIQKKQESEVEDIA